MDTGVPRADACRTFAVQGVRAWRLGSSNVQESKSVCVCVCVCVRERVESARIDLYTRIRQSRPVYVRRRRERKGEKRRQSYPATPPVRTRQTIIHHQQTTTTTTITTTTTTSSLVVLPATFPPFSLLFPRPHPHPLFDPVKGLSPSRMPCHLLKRIISLFETLAIL